MPELSTRELTWHLHVSENRPWVWGKMKIRMDVKANHISQELPAGEPDW
jgi:hypothetical protein